MSAEFYIKNRVAIKRIAEANGAFLLDTFSSKGISHSKIISKTPLKLSHKGKEIDVVFEIDIMIAATPSVNKHRRIAFFSSLINGRYPNRSKLLYTEKAG